MISNNKLLSLAQKLQYKLGETSFGGVITAYHGGQNFAGGFSLNFLGSGEGILYLGPGVYFSTNKETARLYCKYAKPASLYTVRLDSSGLYDPTFGEPYELREKLLALLDETEAKHGRLPSADSFKFGKGTIGILAKFFGKEQFWQKMREIGISGTYEKLPNSYEIAVFDPSIVEIVDKESCE